jgi:uncharacterized protein (TIGR00251 family)
MNFYRWQGQDLHLTVQVQTRASQTAIIGIQNDKLKIKTTAAPVEGQANAELIKLLAKTFDVAKSHVVLLGGHSSREKHFLIQSPQKLPDLISPAQ